MTGTLAVVSQSGRSLSFYDVSTGERTGYIDQLVAEPHELSYDAKRELLYVSHAYRHGHYWAHGDNSHEISVVDVVSREVVDIIDTSPAKGPHGLYINEAQDTLYVSVEELPLGEGGGVIGINLSTRKIVKTVPSESKSHWFVLTPDAKKAYTCNKTASFVSVLDMEKETMIGKIEVPGCEEPGISPDGRHVYFPTPGMQFSKSPANPIIKVIDTTTDAVVADIPTTSGILPVHVTPQGTILAGQYVYKDQSSKSGPSLRPGILGVYDPNTYKLLGEVSIGEIPLTIRCSVDGKTAFVANILPGTVTVVDLESLSEIRTLAVDVRSQDSGFSQGAHGLAFIP